MGRTSVLATQRAGDSSPRNIVVFGESGVGKSSLINLIAGRSVAATSNNFRKDTPQHEKYLLRQGEMQDGLSYMIWDAPELSQSTSRTEKSLKRLLDDLSGSGGIHLLVHCVRTSSFQGRLLSNYNIFYSAICRKKVPIVVVVTGLEGYRKEMDDWWMANEGNFAKHKMHFDGHACVTTLGADQVGEEELDVRQRRLTSMRAVRSLIATKSAYYGWGPDRKAWVSTAFDDVLAMLKPQTNQPHPIIVMYNIPEPPLDPIASTSRKSVLPFEGGRFMDSGGSTFLVYRIHDQHLHAGMQFKKEIAFREADLLIACASVRSDPRRCRQATTAFYGSYGGDMRPLLIIAKDAPSDERAQKWWKEFYEDADSDRNHGQHSHHQSPPKLLATFCVLPPPMSPDVDRSLKRLRHAIQTRSLKPVPQVNCLFGKRRPPVLHSASTDDTTDCLMQCGVWSLRSEQGAAATKT